MKINEQFMEWVRVLYENAFAAVDLNGSPGNEFKI